MVITQELKGSKEEIARQLEQMDGRVISAIIFMEKAVPEVERGGGKGFVPPTDEEFERLMKKLESLTVAVGHVDDSREAIYTRMPGE
ncbi:MAG: hypothetical protein FWD61_09290 [Phycisphaerales bacterium]|nr:hypothetical protein [Phycisphaerales bacterium]